MKQRTITSVFIVLTVALAIGAKFLPFDIGTYVFDIFILCLIFVGSMEMCRLLEENNRPLNRILATFYPVFNYAVLLIFVNFVPYKLLILVQFLMLAVYFVATILIQTILKKEHPIKSSLNTLYVCIYPAFLFANFLIINHIEYFAGIKYFSVVLILLVFAITFLTDTCAYIIGILFKGPKLAPKISPKKTISGSIGGLLGGMGGAMLVYVLVKYVPTLSAVLTNFSISWWIFLLVGFLGSILGQFGDLFESLIKRKAGVKDSGNIFPGHGGMLDRIDAMIFVVTFISVFATVLIA